MTGEPKEKYWRIKVNTYSGIKSDLYEIEEPNMAFRIGKFLPLMLQLEIMT